MTLRREEALHGRLSGGALYPPALVDNAEEELARLLKARSVAAWETLFERHFDRVFRYALGRLLSREAAEDVAAATFDRAFSTIETYSYRGRPVLAWLYGIARNVVNESRRREMRRHAAGLIVALRRRQNGHGAPRVLSLSLS